MVLEQGKLAFVVIAKTIEEPLADEPAENGIAQEFQAFVVKRRARRTGFVGARAVGEGANQKRPAVKPIAEGRFQFVEVRVQNDFFTTTS
jgi:hypothetical protein